MRKATLKASVAAPTPKRWAKTDSRTRPMTRLTAVPTVTDRTPREMSSMLRPLLDICGRQFKAYNGPMSFDDKARPPGDNSLAKALAVMKTLAAIKRTN